MEILPEKPAFKALLPRIATNYAETLLTVQQIEVNGTFITEGHPSSEPEFLQYFERGERPSDKSKRYVIAILYNGSESISELFKILKTPFDPNGATLDKAPLVQWVNIITTTTASERPTTYDAGAHTKLFEWDRKSQRKLGFGLVVIRGFYTSVRACTSRVLVNFHCSNAVFYKDIKLSDLVDNIGSLFEEKLQLLEL
ncbi:hypothetical protein ABVK25_000655 [Lepraria finkii]|uniref:Argonaute linker 1 domain-containing protein n=1 Tax=Lepraria finkii TaxID=1340010 RepID=A0ABR4BNH6_9LECA